MLFAHESTYRDKRKIFFRLALLIIFVTAIITSAFIYGRVSIGINKGKIGYCMQDDKLMVFWQTASDRNKYRFSRYDEDTGEYIFCGEYADGVAELDGIAPGQKLLLKMQRVRTISVLGFSREIFGIPRVLTVIPEELNCPILAKTADPEERSIKISWNTEPYDRYEVFLMNGEGTFEPYTETENGEIVLCMEDHAELSGREQEIGIAVRTIRPKDDYLLYSTISDLAVINRADLMDSEVHLRYEENEEQGYDLIWQESKGDWYELQEWSYQDREWISRQVYRWSDPLLYDTGWLPSCTKMRFRVITYNDTEMRDREEFAADPSEAVFRTGLSPIYCTVWPLMTLDIYEDVSGSEITGLAPAGEALCVLEETEGYFLVRYEDKYGYIDSRYCLIDLAEYLGELCKYNITNSYSSIFRVHGYIIPEVTGGVIQGYENIYMEDGEMLVPFLYPCAQKLYKAALRAEEDGFFLCIYDAFRPNEATRYLYDTAEIVLDWPALEKDAEDEESEENEGEPEDEESEENEERPEDEESEENEGSLESGETDEARVSPANEITEKTIENLEWETGLEQEDLTEKILILLEELDPRTIGILKGLSGETLMAFYTLPQEHLTPEDLAVIQGLSEEEALTLKEMPWEELAALKLYVDNMQTYQEVMTDNRFRLGSFLAQAVSTHNRGIALDLTLMNAAAEEELEMQSDMHDLSWYSIPALNNTNADLLAFYMEGVGYHGISSEWWHFQDDETRNQLNLGYMEKGLSPEGWKRDGLGWRYRQADGSYYYADTVMIDNKECTFNAEGYLVEE